MWCWMLKYAVQQVESCWTLLNENKAWLYSVQQVAATMFNICWSTKVERCWTVYRSLNICTCTHFRHPTDEQLRYDQEPHIRSLVCPIRIWIWSQKWNQNSGKNFLTHFSPKLRRFQINKHDITHVICVTLQRGCVDYSFSINFAESTQQRKPRHKNLYCSLGMTSVRVRINQSE